MLQSNTMRPRLMNMTIGKDVLDLFHLMRGHDDRAAAIEVVVQQRIVELLAIQDVEAKRRLVQHQQSRVNRHDQSEVQLGHHALRQFPDLAGALDGGLRKKTFRLRAIESRMHAGDVIERLRNPHPARQHGDIGNEADIAHELIALGPGIASEHPQFSLIWGEAENRVERGGLACAVGTDESEDAALFDSQIDAVQRDGCAEGLAEAACFYACHGFSAPLRVIGLAVSDGAPSEDDWPVAAVQEFFRRQAEPLNGGVDPRPFFGEKLLPFALQQQTARAGIDEHAEASLALDQPLVHQLLIALQNRERIDPIFGRDVAHRGQRIAFLEHAVEYHATTRSRSWR